MEAGNMQITDIKESGSNNILLWAISNGANIKEDVPLSSLIHDELFYSVTLSDVNFFELFRLTQVYRDKLRIINEKQAELPLNQQMKIIFPGSMESENEEPGLPLMELAAHSILLFLNMTSQMTSDDDIIHPGAIRLFLPMITRKFDIQIPVSFMDFIESMSPEECQRVFTHEYPKTISEIISSDIHGFKNVVGIGFVKTTNILRYDKQYDKYLKAIKYAPLKSYQEQKLYKLVLLGFFKRDNIARTELRCSLFKTNTENIQGTLKRMSRLTTPLELDVMIQLPIQYMQLLENSFSREVLPMNYQSSMSSILDNGLIYEDFKTSEYNEESEDENEQEKYQEYTNKIEAYRTRITEANETLLKAIPMLLDNQDVDVTSVFSMLPSIYKTNAMITVNMEYMPKFLSHSDSLIVELFQEISDMASSVVDDLRKIKDK